MKFFTTIVLIACSTLAATTAAVVPDIPALSLEANLLHLMARSSSQRMEPGHMIECNNFYKDMFDELHSKYMDDMKACATAYNSNKNTAEQASLDNQNDLATRTEASCSDIRECEKKTGAEDIFKCYTQSGQDNSKALKQISQDASTYLLALQSELSRIEYEQQQCNAVAEAEYENLSSNYQNEYVSCVNGAAVPKK